MNQFNSYKKSQQMALENAPANKVEAWALSEAARRLHESKEKDNNDIIEQVRLNWRIWTIIQAELVDPDCPIPSEIRQNLLNLSNFIDRRSIDLIAKPDPAKLDILININRQIASGLSGSPEDNQQHEESMNDTAQNTTNSAITSDKATDQGQTNNDKTTDNNISPPSKFNFEA